MRSHAILRCVLLTLVLSIANVGRGQQNSSSPPDATNSAVTLKVIDQLIQQNEQFETQNQQMEKQNLQLQKQNEELIEQIKTLRETVDQHVNVSEQSTGAASAQIAVACHAVPYADGILGRGSHIRGAGRRSDRLFAQTNATQ